MTDVHPRLFHLDSSTRFAAMYTRVINQLILQLYRHRPWSPTAVWEYRVEYKLGKIASVHRCQQCFHRASVFRLSAHILYPVTCFTEYTIWNIYDSIWQHYLHEYRAHRVVKVWEQAARGFTKRMGQTSMCLPSRLPPTLVVTNLIVNHVSGLWIQFAITRHKTPTTKNAPVLAC